MAVNGFVRTTIVADADARTFESVYESAWSPLFRYCLVLVRNPADAEDVASETVRRAFAAWQKGRRPRGDALPWLFVIARRIVIDLERRRRVLAFLRLGPDPEADDESQSIRSSEVWIWFEELRRALPKRQAEALALRYGHDMSDQAIAQIMGISEAGVRMTVSRALDRLRNEPEVFR